MAHLDHLGISVRDVRRAAAQFDPLMSALGYTRHGDEDDAWWRGNGLVEVILYEVRPGHTEPHEHGRVGWQHLAFRVDSRAEVDQLHALAIEAGWSAVRAPKEYPRFSEHYYATFLEDDDGIRLEFMHDPD